MQIHELNEAFGDLIKGAGAKAKGAWQRYQDQSVQANIQQAKQQQEKTQAQAAQYAERLKRQGYQAPVTPAPQAEPAPTAEPIQIGGQTIKPTDPQYAKIMGQAGATAAPQTTAQATAKPAAAQPVAQQQQQQAIRTGSKQAQPVRIGQAGAIMTTPDFQAALRQLRLTPQQFDELKQTVQSNPAFTNTLLKQLGLKR